MEAANSEDGTHYIIGGLILIVLGLLLIAIVRRYPAKNNSRYSDLKFRVYGIAFILCGIAVLIAKLLGKL